MTNQRLNSLNPSYLFLRNGGPGKGGFFSIFLFCCLLLQPVCSFAQNSQPTITLKTINYLKANAAIVFPIEKQSLPFREKIAVHFNELGMIYNPEFPNTRKRVYVESFEQKATNFKYIGKSYSTNRSTVFIRNTGKFYGIWDDGKCVSLIEYEVSRVGQQLEITGKVYSCLVTS